MNTGVVQRAESKVGEAGPPLMYRIKITRYQTI
jgi:hypothetical protein